jgi:site-specific recombinase XerD
MVLIAFRHGLRASELVDLRCDQVDLEHALLHELANDGVDTRTIQASLGHKSIQHTVRYTESRLLGSKAYSWTDCATFWV